MNINDPNYIFLHNSMEYIKIEDVIKCDHEDVENSKYSTFVSMSKDQIAYIELLSLIDKCGIRCGKKIFTELMYDLITKISASSTFICYASHEPDHIKFVLADTLEEGLYMIRRHESITPDTKIWVYGYFVFEKGERTDLTNCLSMLRKIGIDYTVEYDEYMNIHTIKRDMTSLTLHPIHVILKEFNKNAKSEFPPLHHHHFSVI